MDNIDEITKRVEDTQKEVVVKGDNVKIAPTEPGRQYSSMSMPMTRFISNADIKDDTVDDEVTQKIQSEVNNALKDDKFVNKKSRKLAKVGDKLVEEEIKALLNSTDYQAIQWAEGVRSEEIYAPMRIQREEWRQEIRKIEAELGL